MSLRTELVRIVQDDEVQRLSFQLRRFSPFDVLRVGHYELRHTNTLAWLLDPAANHGLDDTFLRAFIARLGASGELAHLAERFETASDHSATVRREVRLSQLRGQAPEGERLGLDEATDDDLSATDDAPRSTRGRRTEGAVDVLIDGDGWILAIEAKIRSGEGKGQLSDYQAALRAYAGQKLLVPVYLTIDGDEPSEPGWTAASWRESVIAPLEKTLAIHCDLLPEVRSFLTSYLDTLKRHAGNGDEAEALAKTLSRKFAEPLRELQAALGKAAKSPRLDAQDERLLRRHAPTIKILLNQLVSGQSVRAERIEGLLQQQGFLRLEGPSSYIPFVPRDWATLFPAMLRNSSGCVLFEVVNRTPEMTIKLVVPSLGEGVLDPLVSGRRKLVQLIHESGNKEAFPGAFYKRPGVIPRPASPRYYSVYTKKFKLPKESSEEAAARWVESALDTIKRRVLPAIEPLMKHAGLGQ